MIVLGQTKIVSNNEIYEIVTDGRTIRGLIKRGLLNECSMELIRK